MRLCSVIVRDKGVCEDASADSEVALNQSDTGHKIFVHQENVQLNQLVSFPPPSRWDVNRTHAISQPSFILTKIIPKDLPGYSLQVCVVMEETTQTDT